MLRSHLLRSPLLWRRSLPPHVVLANGNKLLRPPPRLVSSSRLEWRAFSDDNNNKKASEKATSDDKTKEDSNSDSKDIVLTPGEQVVAVTRLGMWGGIFAFACVCGYYIVKELMPTKMSPNRIFDRSFDVLRADAQVQERYGAGIKAYGRDHGGHREGRRNFIEHKEYVDELTGDKRVRVRYNIEGPYGKAFVFAEVSASQPSDEFVYILVQDKANGRTQTIVDNRAALAAKHMAGGNEQASSAISQLLTGGGSGSSPKN